MELHFYIFPEHFEVLSTLPLVALFVPLSSSSVVIHIQMRVIHKVLPEMTRPYGIKSLIISDHIPDDPINVEVKEDRPFVAVHEVALSAGVSIVDPEVDIVIAMT